MKMKMKMNINSTYKGQTHTAVGHLAWRRHAFESNTRAPGQGNRRHEPPHRHTCRANPTSTSYSIGHGGDPNGSNASDTKLKVSFQGVHGAYSEQAARKCFPEAELVPCPDFETTHASVASSVVDRAVIPVENSLGGSIHANYDLLMKYRLHIVGEVYHKVRHCLQALPGVQKSAIKRVMSHPQALAQCDQYLNRLQVIKQAVDDTAGAAEMIAEKKMTDAAALASSLAATLYGLDILDEDCQDNEDNLTRFLVLARQPQRIEQGMKYKTSIVFSTGHRPGDLFKSLSVFSLRDIDLTKIENRPMPQSMLETLKVASDVDAPYEPAIFENLFYVDFVGSLGDEMCQNSLRHLNEVSPFMRILGSYPEADL